ncbi:TFIIE alpha subunit [Ancylostoma ceylanicum]|uniref:TFIIE alpha subunit n=2 Tax=Ancylostoma TaxID=29169 RepID=A0A0D6LYK0_9BILA|nr:TFIIE alpha subunit [Ancylostoma ceylanicum]
MMKLENSLKMRHQSKRHWHTDYACPERCSGSARPRSVPPPQQDVYHGWRRFPHIPDETVENNSFMYNIAKGEDWPKLATSTPKIKIMSARDHMEKLSNADFQAVIKQLYDSKEGLTEWQLRLLEWYLLEVRASGLDKTDEKTRKLIGSWSKFIDEYRSKYISNVMATNDQVVYTITDKAMLKDAPPHILQKLAVDPAQWEQGPWRGRMTPHTIHPFMQYCGNRQLRAEAWEKWISKASFDHDFYNNSLNVEELRHNNEGLAKALGYTSVADHRLANKMAASPETVRNFLNALTRRIRPVFIDRMESWTAFAQAKEMMSGDLQAHDMAYICRREAEQHYDVDPLDLMNHFPFWPTFHNLTNLIGHIFGLQFKDITDSGLERAHQDARIFSVMDMTTEEHLGRLYIDPYDRESKRVESQTRGLDKLVYLVGSAIAPTETTPSLLHHQQLQQLLFHVGRAVQMLLSRSPYRDIAIPWAPFYASDWDALDMFPAFLQFFVYKPTLLQSLSSPHLVNESTISDEQANNICLALSRATLWESYRSLFWSDYDLTIFEMEDRKQKFWLDLYREMFKEYFPFKPGRNDYHPCSFIPIFGLQPYMGMYYRKLWTEMLALDIHETFDYEDDVVKTGERLKATVLSRGSGDVAKELYRRFQGRDPSVGAICDFYDPPSFYHLENEAVVRGLCPAPLHQLVAMRKHLRRLLSLKCHREHYLVVYYIMRSVCIREENLRSRLNFDQKQLRQLLAGLKNEKLVKDRLLQQKNETGRNVSIIFYFINYRAIINVLKYKIDHMRQMLEAREKNELQKANYKCEQCGAQYEDMDIDRIFDPQTGTLKCWRCQGEVTQDITGGPTQVTRTLLARFNEQMLPLFAAIRELAGIQLAPHLLEPDINQYLAEEDKGEFTDCSLVLRNKCIASVALCKTQPPTAEPQQQLLDFSTSAGGNRAQLGGVAHSYNSGPSIKYANADQITVDLNADANSKPVEEAKVVPTWLQDDAIGGSEQDTTTDTINLGTESAPPISHASSSVSLSLMAELEGVTEEPAAKRQRTSEGDNGATNAKRAIDVVAEPYQSPYITNGLA